MTDKDKGMVRRSKDKLPKDTKPVANVLKGSSQERLLAKLQKESLKVHGDPLDPKKSGQKRRGN